MSTEPAFAPSLPTPSPPLPWSFSCIAPVPLPWRLSNFTPTQLTGLSEGKLPPPTQLQPTLQTPTTEMDPVLYPVSSTGIASTFRSSISYPLLCHSPRLPFMKRYPPPPSKTQRLKPISTALQQDLVLLLMAPATASNALRMIRKRRFTFRSI
jgi:hypothetical protein